MGFQLGEAKLKHGKQADGACANNYHISRLGIRLHRAPLPMKMDCR
jgi:hypothetical protein